MRADAGDGPAATQLSQLLRDRGDLDGLTALADAGDEKAAFQLLVLLAFAGIWTG